MNIQANDVRKNILNDPVGEYLKLNPDSTKKELSKLDELYGLHSSLRTKFDELDSKTKDLSRRIGRLKKEGSDITDFKNHMQSYSKEKAGILKNIKGIEIEILDYFNAAAHKNSTKVRASKIISNRVYLDEKANTSIISVKLLEDNHSDWNNYVTQNQAASIYHRAEWRALIKKTFGHDGYYLYAIDQKGIVKGILPLIHMKSRIFGEFLVSMPYFNYGGAVADHPDIEILLMKTAEEYAAGLNVEHIEYRDDIPRNNYSVRTDKVNMIFPLPSSEQDLWEEFTPKLRAQIKRPQREKIEVQKGHLELLNNFYQVFSRNMRDLGTPVYAKSFFHNILNIFPSDSSILVVSLNNKPVAAAFLIKYGDTLEIPWASSLHEINHLSINMLMYWEVIRFAIAQGCQYFDFGRSSKEAGTYKFKKQWGAKPKQLYWHYWLSQGGEMPTLSPNNPKFQAAINIWKRLPVVVTKLIGPSIVKNLP